MEKIINIGTVTEMQLEQVGIHSIEDLKRAGAKTAFIQIRSLEPDACICKLYALQGAIEGISWHSLSPQAKNELKNFFNRL